MKFYQFGRMFVHGCQSVSSDMGAFREPDTKKHLFYVCAGKYYESMYMISSQLFQLVIDQ